MRRTAHLGAALVFTQIPVPLTNDDIDFATGLITGASLIAELTTETVVKYSQKQTAYRREGATANSVTYVEEETFEINFGHLNVHDTAGAGLRSLFSGQRIDVDGKVGASVGGPYTTFSIAVLGENLRNPNQFLLAAIYAGVQEGIEETYSHQTHTESKCVVRGTWTANGIGRWIPLENAP